MRPSGTEAIGLKNGDVEGLEMEGSMSWCLGALLCGSLSILFVWRGMERMCGKREMSACEGEWGSVGGSGKGYSDGSVTSFFLTDGHPTQSIMYIPLQVNRFQKRILLIAQYKYLKSCSEDFILKSPMFSATILERVACLRKT